MNLYVRIGRPLVSPLLLVSQYGGHEVATSVVTRRICQGSLSGQAGHDLVGGKHIAQFHRMGHWLNVGRVDFGQKVDITKNLPQLCGHGVKLGIGELEPGQEGHLFDIIS